MHPMEDTHRLIVYVHFVKLHILSRGREFFEDGRDSTARATPGRPEVNRNCLILISLDAHISTTRLEDTKRKLLTSSWNCARLVIGVTPMLKD
jgi:hypothetical protein